MKNSKSVTESQAIEVHRLRNTAFELFKMGALSASVGLLKKALNILRSVKLTKDVKYAINSLKKDVRDIENRQQCRHRIEKL